MRPTKEIKHIQNEKEQTKLSLIADDMIVHLESHKFKKKKILERIREFSKVTENKFMTYLSMLTVTLWKQILKTQHHLPFSKENEILRYKFKKVYNVCMRETTKLR